MLPLSGRLEAASKSNSSTLDTVENDHPGFFRVAGVDKHALGHGNLRRRGPPQHVARALKCAGETGHGAAHVGKLGGANGAERPRGAPDPGGARTMKRSVVASSCRNNRRDCVALESGPRPRRCSLARLPRKGEIAGFPVARPALMRVALPAGIPAASRDPGRLSPHRSQRPNNPLYWRLTLPARVLQRRGSSTAVAWNRQFRGRIC